MRTVCRTSCEEPPETYCDLCCGVFACQSPICRRQYESTLLALQMSMVELLCDRRHGRLTWLHRSLQRAGNCKHARLWSSPASSFSCHSSGSCEYSVPLSFGPSHPLHARPEAAVPGLTRGRCRCSAGGCRKTRWSRCLPRWRTSAACSGCECAAAPFADPARCPPAPIEPPASLGVPTASSPRLDSPLVCFAAPGGSPATGCARCRRSWGTSRSCRSSGST